jgi:hypothetical protein
MVFHADQADDDMLAVNGQKTETKEEEKEDAKVHVSGDRAMAQFSVGSLYAITNQHGVTKPFIEDPKVGAFTSGKAVPESLRLARHSVPDFYVYDGAHATIAATGKTASNRDQLLPKKSVTEQDAVEYNRWGSKKGWLYNSKQEGPGGQPESMPTGTQDGWTSQIQQNHWFPVPRSEAKQGLATREMPAIDIQNNARGIGTGGNGRQGGGMQGGYREVNPERLKSLPIPMEKFNWTGNRLAGTAREDQGAGAGAGGYRAGFASMYPDRPSFPERRTTGISRVTQNAA